MNNSLLIAFGLLPTMLAAVAQESSKAPPALGSSGRTPSPPALGVPKPGPTNDAPYAPQPILQGVVIVPLYPPDSHRGRSNGRRPYPLHASLTYRPPCPQYHGPGAYGRCPRASA